MGFDDRQLHAINLHLAIALAGIAQPVGATDLEPDEVVGVVHHAHPVGFGIAHPDTRTPTDRCGWRVGHARELAADPTAAARSARVALSGLPVPKIACPATRILTPAATTAAALLSSMPPSISIGADERARVSTSRTRRTFSMLCGMNGWPPKPGFTDMTSTWSRSCAISSSTPAGVAGFNTAPARAPSFLINPIVRCRCGTASTWTEIMSAPASTNAAM